jgi:hypothetical protein
MNIRTQTDALPSGATEEFDDQPWTGLTTQQDVENWIDLYNHDLRLCVKKPDANGYGVCFTLLHGGQIFMHTAADAILLDVMPDAEWAAPVITAATGVAAPGTQIWVLPDDKLTQLVLGLSPLIASTRMVVSHRYKGGKY